MESDGVFIRCKERYMGFFFFSSRRRHTRLVSDWSSDVCSSDLMVVASMRSAVCEPVEGMSGRVPVLALTV